MKILIIVLLLIVGCQKSFVAAEVIHVREIATTDYGDGMIYYKTLEDGITGWVRVNSTHGFAVGDTIMVEQD